MKTVLDENDAYALALACLSPGVNPEEKEDILVSLYHTDTTADLLIGFTKAMKNLSKKPFKTSAPLMDVCGTGGDGLGTFNISTLVGLLTSACGLKVAKHGNRAVTGKCGSFDLIDALGLPYDHPKDIQTTQLDTHHLALLYAPSMHPAMQHIMPIRKRLSHPTIFNIIGPLCNPFDLSYQVIGVYTEKLLMPMAQAMQKLGVKNGYVVHGYGGMDELSLEGVNQIVHVTQNALHVRTLDPRDYPIKQFFNTSLSVKDKAHALFMAEQVISGLERGPYSEVVIWNTALALHAGGYDGDLNTCIGHARHTLTTGKLKIHLDTLKEVYHVS